MLHSAYLNFLPSITLTSESVFIIIYYMISTALHCNPVAFGGGTNNLGELSLFRTWGLKDRIILQNVLFGRDLKDCVVPTPAMGSVASH